MANTASPYGLRPVGTKSGAPWNGAVRKCYVASGTGNIFIGDPVVLAGSGDAGGNYPDVALATAGDGNPVDGVVVAIEPLRTDLSVNYSKTGSNRYVYVCMASPDIIFQAQDDGSGTPATTMLGANANLVAGSGGSTSTGYSSWALDATTPSADQSNQLTIIGRPETVNEDLDDYCSWLVVINNSHLFGTTTGLGLGV